MVGLIFGASFILYATLQILNPFIKKGEMGVANLPLIMVPFFAGLFFVLISFISTKMVTIHLKGKDLQIDIRRLNILIQFIVLAAFTVFEILKSTSEQYPLSMVFVTFLLGFKYRLIGKRGFIIYLTAVLVLFQISAWFSGDLMKTPYFLLHAIFSLSIIILLLQNDFQRHFRLMKGYRDRLISLNKQVDRYKDDTIDISTIDFTPREIEILRALCLTYNSNKDLAESLDISVHTIKTHMKNIFDKTGVDDRYQLIDLFKADFLG